MPQRNPLTCGTWPCVEWHFGIPQLRRYAYHSARRSFVDHTGEIITSWVQFWPHEANRVVNSRLLLLTHEKRIARQTPASYKRESRVKQRATYNLPVFLDSSSPGFVIRWRPRVGGRGSLGSILVPSKVRLRSTLRMIRFRDCIVVALGGHISGRLTRDCWFGDIDGLRYLYRGSGAVGRFIGIIAK